MLIKQLVEKMNEQKILESPVNKRSEPITKIYPNLVEPFIKNVICLLVVLYPTKILSFNLAEWRWLFPTNSNHFVKKMASPENAENRLIFFTDYVANSARLNSMWSTVTDNSKNQNQPTDTTSKKAFKTLDHCKAAITLYSDGLNLSIVTNIFLTSLQWEIPVELDFVVWRVEKFVRGLWLS